MTPTFFACVGGTWDWDDNAPRWYKSNSDFSLFMGLNGFHHIFPNMHFSWSAELDGVPLLPTRTKHSNWVAGAHALIYYLQLTEIPLHKRNVICHSHGLQVILYACGQFGLRLNNLISVASPIRDDMKEIADIARDNIEKWLHIRDSRWDLMGNLGQFFDGRKSWDRTNSLADDEDVVEGISHSKILRDKTCFHLWLDRRWLNFLAFGDKDGK